MSQYTSYTNEMIEYLEQYLKAFHDHKDVFKEYQGDKSSVRKVREVTARIQGENSECHDPRDRGNISYVIFTCCGLATT